MKSMDEAGAVVGAVAFGDVAKDVGVLVFVAAVEVGSGEDALAEVRRAEGAEEFALGSEFVGDGLEVLAVAADEFFLRAQAPAASGGAKQDFGGGGGIREGAVGREAPGA